MTKSQYNVIYIFLDLNTTYMYVQQPRASGL